MRSPVLSDISLTAPTEKKSNSRRWQRFLLAIIPFIERWVQNVPRKNALRFGRSLGNLAFLFADKARKTAFKNLRFIFGDSLSEIQREKMVRGVFQHFAMMVIDFLRGPSLKTPEDLNQLIVSVEGWDENIAPILAQGRGIMICTPHFGNWELLGRYVVSRGVPLTVVTRNPEDPDFAAWAKRMREGAGFSVVSRGESPKKLISTLKRGEALAILPDQSSKDTFIPFFGIPSGTVVGPALLAARTNAVLVTCVGVCDPAADYRYRFYFDPAIPIENTNDRDLDYSNAMAKVNAQLEMRIREWPEQWLWLHDRWKTTFEEGNREKLPEGTDLAALRQRFQ